MRPTVVVEPTASRSAQLKVLRHASRQFFTAVSNISENFQERDSYSAAPWWLWFCLAPDFIWILSLKQVSLHLGSNFYHFQPPA